MNIPDNFQKNRQLSQLATLGIGGEALYFVEVKDVKTMRQTLEFCSLHSLPYFILGKGSNCLFDDRGFHGVVIANRIDFLNKPSDGFFHAGAGYSFSLLGVQTARQGWSGLEFASGIPGSVGGAVYMNAGANGLETCQSLVSVEFVRADGTYLEIPRSELDFHYRRSPFQEMSGAIVGATFALKPSPNARSEQLTIIEYRKKTQPYGEKSAGCMFRNPALTCSAGALIEQAGLKGKTIGGAQVSSVHANFLINTGRASSQDMLALIESVKKEVKLKATIELESEVRYIPYERIEGEKNA